MTTAVTPRPIPPSDPVAASALRACLRFLLDPGTTADPRWSLPPGVVVIRFQAMILRHRLVPFLHTHRDRLDLPDDLTSWLRSRGDASRLRCLVIARELIRALDVLAEAGLPVLVVKGLALAQTAHHDLAARGPGDLDLLVRPEDAGRAHQVLSAAGWRAPAGHPQPAQARLWDYTVSTGYEHPFFGTASMVDLHWRLDPTLGGLPDFDSLWGRRTSVELYGRSVPTLGVWDTLLHSSSHAAKDDWKWLRSLVDLVVLAGRAEPWRDENTPAPTRIQLVTLGIAFDLLGTPAAVPAEVASAARRAARCHRTPVIRRQALVELSSRGRFPWSGTLDAIRRWSRGSWAPADLRRVVLAAVIPPRLLGGLADQPPPAAAWALVRIRLGRLRSWFPSSTTPAR